MKRLAIAIAIGLFLLMSREPSSSAQAGFPPPSDRVNTTDIVWASPGGEDLMATVYVSKSGGSDAPLLVDVHGGAWGAYDRTADRIYAERLTEQGLVVMSIDFRQAPAVQHPVSRFCTHKRDSQIERVMIHFLEGGVSWPDLI